MTKIREILEKYADTPLTENDKRIYEHNFDKLAEDLDNLDNWISVEDELPKKLIHNNDTDWYSVYLNPTTKNDNEPNYDVGKYNYYIEEWMDDEGLRLNVTHWQPIKPPKEKK